MRWLRFAVSVKLENKGDIYTHITTKGFDQITNPLNKLEMNLKKCNSVNEKVFSFDNYIN